MPYPYSTDNVSQLDTPRERPFQIPWGDLVKSTRTKTKTGWCKVSISDLPYLVGVDIKYMFKNKPKLTGVSTLERITQSDSGAYYLTMKNGVRVTTRYARIIKTYNYKEPVPFSEMIDELKQKLKVKRVLLSKGCQLHGDRDYIVTLENGNILHLPY